MAAPPCRHPSEDRHTQHRRCARRRTGGSVAPCCDLLEPRVMCSVVRAAAPFAPVAADAPARYQLLGRGEVGFARDADVFSLGRLQPGDVLTLSLGGAGGSRGSLGDGLLELFRHDVDAAGVWRVAFDDDHGAGADAYLYRFPVTADDIYFVRARSANTVRTGTYELAAWLDNGAGTAAPSAASGDVVGESEPDDSAADAVDLSAAWRPVAKVSSNAGSVVGTGADAYDEYEVQLRAGDVVSVMADSTSALDASVTLLDPGDAVMAQDGDTLLGNGGDPRDAGLLACGIPAAGTYRVRVRGNDNTAGAYRLDVFLSRVPEPPPAAVVGRHVFYNNSGFDGHSAAAGPADDGAVAADKVALLPGRAATLENVTNGPQGINGVMIDVAGLRRDLTLADFQFDVSVPGAPGRWVAAPAPVAITRRVAAGAGGSDRVSVVWPDGAVVDRWLQVTLRASAATGLAADDVFQFGNLVGESGDAAGPAFAVVGLADVLRARARESGAVDVIEWCDFNRDGRVNALDLSVTRARVGHGLAMPGVGVAGEGVVAAQSAVRGPAPRRLWYEVAACGLASAI